MFAVVLCELRFNVLTTSGRRTLLLLSMVASGLLASCDPTGKLLYRGDGTFSDRSEFNRPRYLIRFNKIPIFQTGAYRFRFSGLPHEKMTLVLYVEGQSSREEEEMKSLQTAISFSYGQPRGRYLQIIATANIERPRQRLGSIRRWTGRPANILALAMSQLSSLSSRVI